MPDHPNSHMRSFHIVGTGLFALDVIVHGDGRTAHCALGGSAGNVLSILGSLGWRITPVGMLGEDGAAERLTHELSALGADLSFMLRSHTCVTPIIYQLKTPRSESHHFSFACPICGESRRPSSSNFGVPASTARALPVPDVFFLDRATPGALAIAQQFANQNGIVVFEPSDIGEDEHLFNEILQYADVVKYADDRIEDLDSFDTDHIAVEIKTAGARGLSFRTDCEWRDLAPSKWTQFKIRLAQATGAPRVYCSSC